MVSGMCSPAYRLRILWWLGFGALVVAGSLWLSSGPAEAGATNCDWNSGKVCLYKNSSYATGGIIRYSGSDKSYVDNVFSHCWVWCFVNDNVSSIKNRGNFMDTRHYLHIDWGGDWILVEKGDEIDLWGHWANDELSSHKWVRPR